ncbi:hypothetical protein C4K04_5432 [Pseudomonas chlororaphis]|uniref:Uncharacterized protein n=1 Tax=Pseudomonas chlororaphis TaxID=587753 RepID=A0A3G7TVP5_9PSED|nr:hypothetical protein C4K04_5432 [Pseudomonas chlororaphis]
MVINESFSYHCEACDEANKYTRIINIKLVPGIKNFMIGYLEWLAE